MQANLNCDPVREFATDLGCIPYDPAAFAAKFYGIGLGVIAGTSLLFLIFGAYLVMTSQGNPEQLTTGKSYIYYALLGLLLAIFGFVFIEIIIVDVLKIPGFGS
jgi:hypothetical protein